MTLQGIQIRSFPELPVAIPYLLGYYPHNSVCALTVGHPGHDEYAIVSVTLPSTKEPPPSAEEVESCAQEVADLLRQKAAKAAYLVGYGAGAKVTPVIDAWRRALPEQGIAVKDALRVQDDRCWSYMCDDPHCCPPEGIPLEPYTLRVAAEAVYAGLTALPSREALAATIAPDESAQALVESALQRFLPTSQDEQDQIERAHHRRIREAGLPYIRELAERIRQGVRLPPEEVAWLSVLLCDLRLRDEMWVRIKAPELQQHLEFWSDVLRRVPLDYAAAPATLLAYAAYQDGNFGLASIALDRAQEAEPDYNLALLLRYLIQQGVSPHEGRLQLTPEELAISAGEDPSA